MKKNTPQPIQKKVAEQNMPNKEILAAFGIIGQPIRLPGGQGTSYLVDNVVLKPTKDEVESAWIAEITEKLTSNKFRVAKPIRPNNQAWVYDGWTANQFVQGEHQKKNYQGTIQVSQDFHQALIGIPKPDFFDKRTNVFAVADRIAWGELPLPDFKLTNKPLAKIFGKIKKNNLPNQVIHGDMGTGNVLFAPQLPPAVIDISPYFRPADFSIAIMVIDALVYEGADISILNLCQGFKDFDQLLMRALARRILEYIGHQNHPERINDYTGEIKRHLQLMDLIVI